MKFQYVAIPLLLLGLSLIPLDSAAQRSRGSMYTKGKVVVGKAAPDFTVAVLQGFENVKKLRGQQHKSVTLSKLAKDRPVALIFGSYTWPPFRRSVPTLEKLYRRYGKQVLFLVVYIKEAHPSDGWRSRGNDREGIKIKQPTTLAERFGVAKQCAAALKLSMPITVDQVDGKTVNKDYAGWPERLTLVDKGGKVLYYGDRGPRGFAPNELESAIKKCMARHAAAMRSDLDGALDEALNQSKK